jgi:hypothetical protein
MRQKRTKFQLKKDKKNRITTVFRDCAKAAINKLINNRSRFDLKPFLNAVGKYQN